MNPFFKRTMIALTLSGSILSLQGCFPLVATGVVAGALTATDRRSVGAVADDKAIQVKAYAQISEKFGKRVNVSISSFNRMVLLTGEVPSDAVKREVGQLIGRIESVKSVVNELAVSPESSVSSESSDAIITGRVKTALIDTKDVFANAVKVVTERGTVYLMGRVTQHEGNRIAAIAQGTGGVLRVVKVFDYITQAELDGLQR
jgi:osmotically-inducible protein OsmY